MKYLLDWALGEISRPTRLRANLREKSWARRDASSARFSTCAGEGVGAVTARFFSFISRITLVLKKEYGGSCLSNSLPRLEKQIRGTKQSHFLDSIGAHQHVNGQCHCDNAVKKLVLCLVLTFPSASYMIFILKNRSWLWSVFTYYLLTFYTVISTLVKPLVEPEDIRGKCPHDIQNSCNLDFIA